MVCRAGLKADLPDFYYKAEASLYLRGPHIPDHYTLNGETLNKRIVWARYRLKFEKNHGKWQLYRLNYYSGEFVAEE